MNAGEQFRAALERARHLAKFYGKPYYIVAVVHGWTVENEAQFRAHETAPEYAERVEVSGTSQTV